ncbi:universal stress protein [Pseudoruegeria sp. SK021]|uniref:universal stress protein n=1 Tax=Pseudoruegeria sp. SK021 TaxID=1933035 RepID=UPI000A25705F|nr:universal stress protein [Pseudoruegeria sp. SK021]OSP56639.1 universal stress protein UspA [Pseudoruegeria sp. SK021]
MFSKIMCPVDLAHAAKLTRALQAAADLGTQYDCPVCYVGVTGETPGAVAHSPKEYTAKLAAFAAEQGAQHGHKVTSHACISTDPSADLDKQLLAAATTLDADLIVMASHIPGLADHLWPSHGGQIARRAKASVFVIR